ncbi:hypothetical protein [Halorubrum sp. Atlit-26R]|jgi:hypothetical protein|uniref:hypothetical protein n=1 Tax=Halorubrum sp. Atlit-26R TaxID=2282128 RepID=UPI000EF21C9C|nr:hypothetical protein [Halorubrum sp. Atlit-26R]RLM68483.1 hypothetical protein DVK07_10185 [Halorubrum sp. Atlit-26R]
MATANSPTTTETDEPRIEGPITEFDRYGDKTGATYFRCSGCGVESINKKGITGEDGHEPCPCRK